MVFVTIELIMTTATRKYKSMDDYLAAVPATHRAALKKLRGQIKKLCPWRLCSRNNAATIAASESGAIFVTIGSR